MTAASCQSSTAATSPTTSPVPRSSPFPAAACRCPRYSASSLTRSWKSSPASAPLTRSTASSQRCSSPASSAQPNGPPRSATNAGGHTRRARPNRARPTRSAPRKRDRNERRQLLRLVRGPARAIHCAQAIVNATAQLGIEVRAGLHTGECEVRGEHLGGLAVHIAARVGALAAPTEVLVSTTVKDLVVGSGIDFTDRGEHELKGVPRSVETVLRQHLTDTCERGNSTATGDTDPEPALRSFASGPRTTTLPQ